MVYVQLYVLRTRFVAKFYG